MSKTQRQERLNNKLSTELGSRIMAALKDPDIIEIMLNPDGDLWTEGHESGLTNLGPFDPLTAQSIIGTIAASCETTATRETPIVSGELPIDGSRFEGLLPPVVAAPSFTIRKRAIKVFDFEAYISAGILSPAMANRLRTGLLSRKNILIAGGTGSGKTTLANALIAELCEVASDDRLVIIEDTSEIQCQQNNAVIMRTSDMVDMNRLLRSTMRFRPDRIIVGEVRGPEALTLLKSWNTGHPGGLATVHANSAHAALTRLEQLISEAVSAPMGALIGEAVDLIVFIAKTNDGRRVREMIEVTGFEGGAYQTRIISSLTAKDQQEATHAA